MSNEDLSFLEEGEGALSPESISIMNDLKVMAETLVKLEFNYVTANEKAEQAKKIYDEYRCITLPNAFRLAGFSSVETTSGARVEVKREYHCSPNKNESDQDTMCNWLEKEGGGDLIKRQANVDSAQIPKLIQYAIPHTQKREVNTQSLKAWLKRALGEDKNVATIKLEDIPPCLHFICVDAAEVSI
jgi:sulfatase maturation enzyme AslB (radical SAM superfamily)